RGRGGGVPSPPGAPCGGAPPRALSETPNGRDKAALVPTSLLGSRQYIGGLTIRSVPSVVSVAFAFFVTAYLQNVEAFTPAETGIRLLPLVVAAALVPSLASRLMERAGA